MGIPQKSTRTKTRRRLRYARCSFLWKKEMKTDIRTYRDLDQISEDIRSPKHLEQHKISKAAEDLPGLGQFYCVECAKWFESEHSLVTHRKGSTHKRR